MLITHDYFKPTRVKYGFFTKHLPGSSHRYSERYEAREQNKQIVADVFGSLSIANVDQQHTNKVIIANDYNSYTVADAQVSNKPGIALAVATADCVPILLADEEKRVIGAVHSGWRGARSNIISNAFNKMKELGAENITAIIGPCIKQRSYEVDDNFYNDFISESDYYRNLFIPSAKDKHYLFDLTSYVKLKLASQGVINILDVNRNTYEEEENFFSFRRHTHNPDSPMGSLISVIMLL